MSTYKLIPVNLYIYTQQEIFLISEDKIKTFSNIQTLKEFITSRHTLKQKSFRQKKNDAIWKYRATQNNAGQMPSGARQDETEESGGEGHRPPNRGSCCLATAAILKAAWCHQLFQKEGRTWRCPYESHLC